MGLSILDPRRHNRFDSEASVVELRIAAMVEPIFPVLPLEGELRRLLPTGNGFRTIAGNLRRYDYCHT